MLLCVRPIQSNNSHILRGHLLWTLFAMSFRDRKCPLFANCSPLSSFVSNIFRINTMKFRFKYRYKWIERILHWHWNCDMNSTRWGQVLTALLDPQNHSMTRIRKLISFTATKEGFSLFHFVNIQQILGVATDKLMAWNGHRQNKSQQNEHKNEIEQKCGNFNIFPIIP